MEIKKFKIFFFKLPALVLAISFLFYFFQTYGLTFSAASGTADSVFDCFLFGKVINCSTTLLLTKVSQYVFYFVLAYALATLAYYLFLKYRHKKSKNNSAGSN